MVTTDIRPSTSRRSGPGTRVGYAVAAAINLVLLWLIDVSPGWQSLSWVTSEATAVVPWVNAALATSAAVNAFYLVRDTPLLKSVGDLVSSVASLASAIVTWHVFPFDLHGGWLVLVPVLVVVATIGSAIAVIANLVRATRAAVGAG